MRSGVPLNDVMRLPWLLSLHNLLFDWHKSNKNGILACSALKQKYRHLLNSGLEYDTNNSSNRPDSIQDNKNKLVKPFNVNLNILFIMLDCDRDTLLSRLNNRTNHQIVNGASILDSQFEALEMPSMNDEECCLWTDTHRQNFLCIEKSFKNNTFYYLYALKCYSNTTIEDSVNKIVSDFLPSFLQIKV
jgi:gluconate kinase